MGRGVMCLWSLSADSSLLFKRNAAQKHFIKPSDTRYAFTIIQELKAKFSVQKS